MNLSVGNEVDLMLSLLLLQSVFGATMMTDAAAAQDKDDGPHQPEPPEFIVVAAALGLSTAVSRLTHIAFIIHSLALKNLLIYGGLGGVSRSSDI